jgi:hypothetical protein
MAEPTTAERLLKGAEVLGRLFRSGVFCQNGWGMICTCPVQTEFCKAKTKWLGLASADYIGRLRPDQGSPFYLLESMRCSEADALGLECTVNFEGIGVVLVGKGSQIPWSTLAQYASDERKEDGRAVLMVLAKFTKSCILPPKEVPYGQGGTPVQTGGGGPANQSPKG